MTFPGLKTPPVFHDVRFFLSLTAFEGVLCILSGEVAIAAKLTRLESRLYGKATVLPEDYRSFVVCACEHCAKVVPANTVYGSVVTGQHCEQPLRLCLVVLKQTLHQ